MSRVCFSNPSPGSDYMTDYLIHAQVIVESFETRRNRHKEVYSTAHVNQRVTLKTKGTLRADKRKYNVTTGLPKYQKVYGNGGLIVAGVSIQKRNYTTGVMSCECEVVQCKEERKSNLEMGLTKSNQVKIFDKVKDAKYLSLAYDLISRKKGANTLGVCAETLDSYSNETIQKVSQDLKIHTFQFKPIRRVFIPKPDGGQRPLGIPSPRDKVVQKSMSMVLEEIYEKKFLPCSHGFRPKRGAHTAIKDVTG